MITLRITEQTPHNMLRAIRAACNELLGDMPAERQTCGEAQAVAPRPNVNPIPQNGVVESETSNPQGERTTLTATDSKQEVEQMLSDDYSPETDSSGTEWSPELHASTKAKNQDGTWKKRRGARDLRDVVSDPEGELIVDPSEPLIAAPAPSLPPIPPAPPAPTGEVVTMNEIWALITNGKSTLDKVLTAAQAMGFADLGAVAQTATPEQRAQLLQELTA